VTDHEPTTPDPTPVDPATEPAPVARPVAADPTVEQPVVDPADDPARGVGEGASVEPVSAASAANADAIAALAKRTNLLIGALAAILVGAFIVIGLLFGRVASAEDDAEAARTELAAVMADGGVSADELTAIQEDLDRVEAGAALYASQIDGFREQLVELSPQIEAGVDEAITGLREFGDSTISFDVNIDEVIPIDTEVVIQRTVEVPIKTEIPINQEIDTTITVDTPLGSIPLDITVPVDVVVPIDLVVDIPIDETVPIQDEFPVKLDVPIAIDVSETELKNLTDSLATGLQSLQDVLTGLGG
jgi:prefoldin subunit 5